MRHDWIIDVLSDLHAYASANGLPALAAKADEALEIARLEIASLAPKPGQGTDDGKKEPGSGRPN